jgi:membrane-associated protein
MGSHAIIAFMSSLGGFIAEIRHYLDPRTIAAAGYLVMNGVIFAETGLAAGFFFPGDSLLFVAGLFAARGDLNVGVLIVSLTISGVLGNAVGYFTGLKLGKRLFSRPKSLLFRPSHLKKAHGFYEKYGNKTIIIARFIPIVRTFAPLVAGAAEMPYGRFALYNAIGGFGWICSMLLGGYFLGQAFPSLAKHIELVVLVIVALSLLPPAIEYLKARRAPVEAATEEA